MTEVLRLKKANCKNCYKCIRHCPVKSIRFSGNQAHIIGDECILCGQCFVVCPQDAKEIVDCTELARTLLMDTTPVYASVAPSFAAYFEGVGFNSLAAALEQLGFAGAEETALGATLVKREYDALLAAGEQDVIISSCCHSVNLLVGKYYPQLVKYLAPVLTPMEAHARDIKRRFPDAKVLFIGPCLSKKDEAQQPGSQVDGVLTFEELSRMLDKKSIVPAPGREIQPESKARLFPIVGGILKSMDCSADAYTYLTVDGTENCIAALEDIAQDEVHRCFIEMSACAGSCIGGPVMEKYRNSPVRHYKAVTAIAGKQDFDIAQPAAPLLRKDFPFMGCEQSQPREEEIQDILKKMGKNSPADELNCGTCGYNTCREKAIAVLRGKAQIEMCLPYLMEKSQRFSDNILNNTPNGILVVNESMEVQQVNAAAMRMLRIPSESDVLGDQVVRIIDPAPFLEVYCEGKQVRNRRDYYAEYKKYLEITVIYDRVSHSLVGILRDVTEEESQRRDKQELCQQTAEIADKVVDKQMRIVQEIASLLGETAAETKVALTKLKESLPYERNE